MEPMMVPNILEKERKNARGLLLKRISLALMFGISFLLFLGLVQRSSSDLSIHAAWAAEGDFLHPLSFLRHGAHPLWHVMVAFVMLLGASKVVAAALVTALLKTAQLWLIHRLMARCLGEKMSPNGITVAAVCVSVVASLWIPWINPYVYRGAGTPNIWHSPTQIIAGVAMMLCVPYTAYCYDAFERRLPTQGPNALLPWKWPVTLGLMLLLSLLAKPTFMQAFLPAACLYFLWQWTRHPTNSRFFWQIMACVLPAVLFMIVQYMYYFGIIVPSQGNMVLEFSWSKLGNGLRTVLQITAFPVYVLGRYVRKDKWKNPLVALTVLFFAVGVLEYLLLGEDGRRASDGNFGWGMMGASLMLWVVMLVVFLEERFRLRQGGEDGVPSKDGKASLGIGYALLLWHLGSGVYYMYDLIFTSSPL